MRIWRDLQEQFHQNNKPRVFQLCKSLAYLHQGSITVIAYFTRLKTLWNELKQFRSDPICHCEGLQMLTESQQKDRIIQFLMGLNESFSSVRSQVLMIEPLPILLRASINFQFLIL